MERNDLRFLVRSAATLPALWLALFALALPFPGGHPSLPGLVAMLPVSVSFTGRATRWLIGDVGGSSVGLAVLILGTVFELGFVGAVAGVAIRRRSGVPVAGQAAWIVALLLYVASHIVGSALVTSRAATGVVLSVSSPGTRDQVLQRIAKDGDRSYRELLLTALEKDAEPDVDENIIGTLTLLEDGTFWHDYLTSPRGSRWGISFWAKVLCDISNKSQYIQGVPGVDFAALSESFGALRGRLFERMVTELGDRPELLNPIFGMALNTPAFGRTRLDELWGLLQRPAIAKCVRLGMSYFGEWSEASHPKHRLYELAHAPCQNWSKADLELWLSYYESERDVGRPLLNAGGLCQFILNTEGMNRPGRPR